MIEGLIDKGIQYSSINIDSSIYYFDQCVLQSHNIQDWDSKVLCLSALSTAYWRKEDIHESFLSSTEALNTIDKYNLNSPTAQGSAYNNIAYYHLTKRNYEDAIEYFTKAFTHEEQGNNLVEISAILVNLGNCYYKKGEYEESIKQYKKAIYIFDLNDQNVQSMVNAKIQLAKSHHKLGDDNKSIGLFSEAFSHLSEIDNQSDFHLSKEKQRIFYNLALLYYNNAESKQFLESIQQAIQHSKKAYNKDLHLCFNLLADWNLERNNLDEAFKYYQQALNIVENKLQNFEFHPYKGLVLFNIAKYHSINNQPELSLQTALRSFEHFNISKDKLADHSSLKLLEFIAELYLEKGDVNNALTYINLGISNLNDLRQSYLDDSSKQILIENLIPLFEKAINTHYKVYQTTGNKTRIDSMLQIAENSKAILLYESINDITAKGIGGIPESLLQLEKELKLEITYLKKKINETPDNEKSKINKLETNLFTQDEKYQKLVHKLERDFPKYHQLKFKNTFAKVEDIQSNLSNPFSCFIEFFVGHNSIFAFKVEKNDYEVYSLETWDEFEKDIEQFNKLIKNPPSHPNATIDFNNYRSIAFRLYENLIHPLNIKENITHLNIVPDDILSTIPFELLLSDLHNSSQINYNIQSLSYLLKKYHISYNYSASVVNQQMLRNNKEIEFNNSFIGFAPNFSKSGTDENFKCNDSYLNSLRCNKLEIEEIANMTNGTSLVNEEANFQNFKTLSSKSKILHLASHSCLNDKNPMENRIFLNDSHIDNYDLYNLELNNELIVLSACQTGSGVLKKGEGVMSLTRGFVHAGCPSVMMSLWAVEDCSTLDIMKYYYQNLLEGKNKDEALSKAKISYLNSADKLHQHPFFWGPFVQIGKTEAITINGLNRSVTSIILLTILIMLIIALKIKFSPLSEKSSIN